MIKYRSTEIPSPHYNEPYEVQIEVDTFDELGVALAAASITKTEYVSHTPALLVYVHERPEGGYRAKYREFIGRDTYRSIREKAEERGMECCRV